jgi:hypothetical protein
MSTDPTIAVNIRFEPYDVYIGRAGKGQDGYYGNPHHGPNHDENIVKFDDYFHTRLKKDPEYRQRILQLKGKRLGCFCKPHRRCHGDIIAEYLNAIPEVKPVKLAVVGSRAFDDYEFLSNILKWYDIAAIISGGARGADSLAARYAKEHGIPLEEFPADWDKLGKAAGHIRNKKMAEVCDEAVAFMDVNHPTPGTTNMIQNVERWGKPVFVYWPSEDPLLDFGV